MHKVTLIFTNHERLEFFYDSQSEAEQWLSFYRRTNQFRDDKGNHLPIKKSYRLTFTR